MEYTVIYSAWIQTIVNPMVYESTDIINVSSKAYCIPINSILNSKIENGSNVRVIILESEREGIDSKTIVDKCKNETEEALCGKDCKVEYIIVTNPFSASKENMGHIFLDLLDKPIEGSTIISDITYGPKYIPMLIFCLLSYAEKFLGCEISNIIYGQVFFEDHEPYDPKLFDVASLYQLSSFSRFFGNNKDEYDSFLKGFFK